jgi:putative transposase
MCDKFRTPRVDALCAEYGQHVGRLVRRTLPDGVFHITTRGLVDRAIFEDDIDRLRFLSLVRRNVRKHDWRIEAFCLLTTHYHLVVATTVERLSEGMRRLNGDYARAFNRRHGRRGHLFSERFSSWVVEGDDYQTSTIEYVLLNPVRAGLCKTPEEWPWSGQRSR